MKRSQINAIMRDADRFIRERGFYLPPFAYWTPAQWAKKGEEVREIADNQMGWDITDFGLGDYDRDGLFLFTVRNGSAQNAKAGSGKLYCEKIMVVNDKQRTPMHFHWNKIEDIINRGGGNLVLKLYESDPKGGLSDKEVNVSTDGTRHTLEAGAVVTLKPGESITLTAGLYHEFWGDGGRVLVGEISLVNDDRNDNRFYESVGRFPQVEEDEDPLYLLIQDVAKYWGTPNK